MNVCGPPTNYIVTSESNLKPVEILMFFVSRPAIHVPFPLCMTTKALFGFMCSLT